MADNKHASIPGFELLEELPVVLDKKNSLIAISDIHLGLEGTATLDGNYVPQVQFSQTKDDLLKASERTGETKILVNGDIKNQFSGTRFTESNEVKKFLNFCSERFNETILVRGNHDNFIDEALDTYGLELQQKYSRNGILYVHGHEEIDPEPNIDTIVIGHEHPALEIEDEVGVTEKIRCLLKGKTENGRKILVLPAFAKASSGTDVNNTPKSELLSPVLKNRVNLDNLTPVSMERGTSHLEFPKLGKMR